ncbi:protein CHROMATIN REMODELING 35 [Physcomitrium patens]|uniref:SNF2 family DNA-dependent ATPase n=1 Tax=Physcomitrium patens TaxID=3218 RepID=A0A2K1L008_PHYPA|nr:protein CHROMATIN REMODELING 35-like [Physcomitrium patens]PNR59365.1 hypothetical protein PHYPA_002156 [Physcomitrium patens]|eukprot:XP_024357560.1 protein CHROMATIN REMODELING 35-like [Physcomitrella patens]
MVHVVVPRMSTVVVDGVGGDMEKVRGRRKKGHVLVDQIAEITGRPKRSKLASDVSRYGTETVPITDVLKVNRTTLKDAQLALEILKNAGKSYSLEKRFRSPLDGKGSGGTLADAVEIDDDDEVQITSFVPRPPLPAEKETNNDRESGKLIQENTLDEEDILGHQILLKEVDIPVVGIEDVQTAKDSPMVTSDSDDNSLMKTLNTLKSVRRAATSALKKIEGGKGASAEEKQAPARGGKGGGVKEANEEEDYLKEQVFGSPKRKESRAVVFAESYGRGPDYEVENDSDSDREVTPPSGDTLDGIWEDIAVMRTQMGKGEVNVEEVTESCEHVYEVKNDVGRACSQCGLIKVDIKDMTFMWRRPCSVRKAFVRGERLDNWNDSGDGVLEEDVRLVGMAQLEAHPSLENAMHPHQLEGFKFLSRNLVEEDSGGCMLAFAPGTGKSFLIISFIQSFMVQVPNARPMIVAPKSMLRPWMQEFKKWEVEEMLVLNLYEADDHVKMLKQWMATPSVLLVGYSQFINPSGEVGKYLTEGPGMIVMDEGHLARTEETKILKSLTRVHTRRRVLLSGTPFNNNFEEFYTTLELVRPNFMSRANAQMFPTLNTFQQIVDTKMNSKQPVLDGQLLKRSTNAGRKAFQDVIGEKFESGKYSNIAKALQQLRVLIEPFVAWHKGQILNSLPGITDLTIMLELTAQQLELVRKNKQNEVRDSLQKRAAAIYVHPILEPVADGVKRSQRDPRLKGDVDVKAGAKLRWVLDMVQQCNDAKEKLLIFSEYLYSLALIENMAVQRMKWSKGLQILRLDGSLPPQERERVQHKFNTDPEVRVLCASIKACGEGISLVGASRVILLEVLWNPSVPRQAISRAFRIGQQRKVVVYRLIAAGTYEEMNMHAAATRKEWLSRLLFDPTIPCDDPNSILWDVTKDCSDSFLAYKQSKLREGVRSIYQREF